MVEKEINEIAVIFNRYNEDDSDIERFVPVRVVEGYYSEDEDSFVDDNQNVYAHMANITHVGNVYGARKTLIEFFKLDEKMTLSSIKEKYLKELQKYEYYKIVDEDSEEFNIIKAKSKETGKIVTFTDKDTALYYEMFEELKEYNRVSKIAAEEPIESNEENTITDIEAPHTIIDKVKKTIKGQDEALESIVTLIWMKYKFPESIKNNMLIIGPSGVGKTAIFEKLRKVLDVPIAITSATGVSQAGYKGHDIEEMLIELYMNSGQNLEKTSKGIIIIDEFDKLADNRDTGEIGTIAVQNELLKIIEGCEKTIQVNNVKTIKLDTSDIIFVCCGAFTELYKKEAKPSLGFGNNNIEETESEKITVDKIVDYGIIRELAGRLPIIIELNDISKDKTVLKDIVMNSDASNLKYILDILNNNGIEVEDAPGLIDYIVEDAIKRKIGARGLINSTIKMFIKVFYEIGNNPGKYEKLILGKNIMYDNNDFTLVPKKVKKLVKTGEVK